MAKGALDRNSKDCLQLAIGSIAVGTRFTACFHPSIPKKAQGIKHSLAGATTFGSSLGAAVQPALKFHVEARIAVLREHSANRTLRDQDSVLDSACNGSLYHRSRKMPVL